MLRLMAVNSVLLPHQRRPRPPTAEPLRSCPLFAALLGSRQETSMRLACTPHKAVQFVSALVLICLCQQVLAGGQFEDWNLEPAVAQAHLVMVARVASISRVT